jgi:hypothetical protein
MKKLFLLSVLLCFVLVGLAATTVLNGQWMGTLKTDDGNVYPLQYNFKVEGDKLTGTVRGPHGDIPINDGQIHGAVFSFDVLLHKMLLVHTGKIYADSIGLDIECDETKAHTVLKRN